MRPVIVILAFLFAPALYSQQPSHGTINILLANRNGMVLITDSRASFTLGHDDHAQKLFRIDPVTVCSIAGFGADPGPNGSIRETAGGDILSAIDGLSTSGVNISFQRKVSSFAALLSQRLEDLESVYSYAAESGPPRSPLIMLFAGFDLDGIAQVAKVTISVNTTKPLAPHTMFKAHVDITMQSVRANFVYLTSGIDSTTQSRLKTPTTFETEPDLSEYRQAFRDRRTADLSLEQMERLARYLEKDASSDSAIGGPVQIAAFSNKHVEVTLPPHLIHNPRPYTTAFFGQNTFKYQPYHPMEIAVPHSVYVDNHFTNSAVVLDGLIVIAGEYTDCDFFFDGDDFYVDPSVQIHGGKLILGPHVSIGSNFYSKARESMPELTPMPYTALPDAENLAKIIWPK